MHIKKTSNQKNETLHLIDSFGMMGDSDSNSSGLYIYNYSSSENFSSHLVVKSAIRDLVSLCNIFSPEIFQKILDSISKESLYIDLEEKTAFRQSCQDTSTDIVKIIDALYTLNKIPDFDKERLLNTSLVSVILAGGKGTRMQSKDTHKVCFPITGRPAINILIEQLTAAGIQEHVVVIGDKSEQVINDVKEVNDNVSFVYQINQIGTGNSAKQAAYYLKSIGYTGSILVISGDKIPEKSALVRLQNKFKSAHTDLAFMTGDKKDWPDSGRVIFDEKERPIEIIEKRDIQKMIITEKLLQFMKDMKKASRSKLIEIISNEINSESKAKVMFPGLYAKLDSQKTLSESDVQESLSGYAFQRQIGEKKFSGQDLENYVTAVNSAVYLFSSEAFFSSIFSIQSDNAQNEEYLPDVAKILAQDPHNSWDICTEPVSDRFEVMSFNNPEELLSIEEYYSQKESLKNNKLEILDEKDIHKSFRPVNEWIEIVQEFGPKIRKRFKKIYGENEDVLKERRFEYLRTFNKYIKTYGSNNEVMIARSPGRVNLMGRHVEHRGGFTNYMTLNREVLLVAGLRNDDIINIHNIDARNYRPRSFSISHELSRLKWVDWMDMINSDVIQELIHTSMGDWSNYFKASALRLQEKFRDKHLNGFNCVLSGKIPQAAGLSSSSALVVAASEVLSHINRLSLIPQEFVDLCGEGEWYVGTRGGCGDHAAMKFGEKGMITHMGFHDVRVESVYPFPGDYKLILMHSQQHAKKSAGARDTFNEKVATYELAQLLVEMNFRQLSDKIHYFRDINADTLGIEAHDIYDILAALPRSISRKELHELIPPSFQELLKTIFTSHAEPENGYKIRTVALYGLAEIARSREFAKLMKEGHTFQAAKLMQISHDGDRVSKLNADEKRVKYSSPDSKEYLMKLKRSLASGDTRASLPFQPGGYECSTPMIDELVDQTLKIEGVIGAQLSGAGLGGFIMALVQKEYESDFVLQITKKYYEENNLEPLIITCSPVQGSNILCY